MQIQESLYDPSENAQLINQADGTISIQSNGATNGGAFAAMDKQFIQNSGEPSASYLEFHEDPSQENISGTALISHSNFDPTFRSQVPQRDEPEKGLGLKSLQKKTNRST